MSKTLIDKTDRRIFCSRPMQSVATISVGEERKNIVTSLSKLVLGAKQPVASHIRSQPRSMLELTTATTTTTTTTTHYSLISSDIISLMK